MLKLTLGLAFSALAFTAFNTYVPVALKVGVAVAAVLITLAGLWLQARERRDFTFFKRAGIIAAVLVAGLTWLLATR